MNVGIEIYSINIYVLKIDERSRFIYYDVYFKVYVCYDFYIYEFLKKVLIIVLIKIWYISIFEMLRR